MIRNILVPTSGSSSDEAVFSTALAMARPLAAHLDFYHVRLSAGEAAVRSPHADFCMGAAIPQTLTSLREKESALSAAAAEHVRSFCTKHAIEFRTAPGLSKTISASYREEQSFVRERLMLHARHSDLVVLGRPSHVDYMPPALLEDLLVGCGRPLVISADFQPSAVTGKIVVGWKETPESARALGAAMPLLEKAREVVLLDLADQLRETPPYLSHVAEQLAWHGIEAEVRVIAAGAEPLTYHLARAAADLHADLLVAGAFGHSRFRELIFGGVTQALLEHASLPVFLMH